MFIIFLSNNDKKLSVWYSNHFKLFSKSWMKKGKNVLKCNIHYKKKIIIIFLIIMISSKF